MKLRENTITRIALCLFVMLLCSNAIVGQTASMNYVRKSQMTAPYTSNPLIDFENARFRDALLASTFLQQDPLAEKYYPFSPYHYGAGNPLKFTDKTGTDWIIGNDPFNYEWRDDITKDTILPIGYRYIGSSNNDILKDLGMSYDLSSLKTTELGMVAIDAEVGKYAVSHLVSVTETTNVFISADVSYDHQKATSQNSMGIHFNGLKIDINNTSYNTGVDGQLLSGSIAQVSMGNRVYESALKPPKGDYFKQEGSIITQTSIHIPKIELGNSLKSIKVSGNWFVNKPEGRTPIVRHALIPYAISFTHQWNLK